MMTQAQLDGYIRIIYEQQTRADRLRAQGLEYDANTALCCRHDAALAIRFAFSAMRRHIEKLEAQEEATR